jgi:hypothetical protein
MSKEGSANVIKRKVQSWLGKGYYKLKNKNINLKIRIKLAQGKKKKNGGALPAKTRVGSM